jgi:hypothetical protein
METRIPSQRSGKHPKKEVFLFFTCVSQVHAAKSDSADEKESSEVKKKSKTTEAKVFPSILFTAFTATDCVSAQQLA